MNDLQLVRMLRATHTFLQFSHHSWIEFDGDDFFDLLQQLDGEVTCSRSDLQYDVGGSERTLFNDRFDYQGILQDVLTEIVT